MIDGREVQRCHITSAERNTLGIKSLHKKLARKAHFWLVVLQGIKVVHVLIACPENWCPQSIHTTESSAQVITQFNAHRIELIHFVKLGNAQRSFHLRRSEERRVGK